MRPDESITFLRSLGYSVVSMPRSDLKPGQTMLRAGKKDLRRLGDLATIMTPRASPLPPVSSDNMAPTGVSGKQSSSVAVDIGVSILGNILKALTGTSLDVSAGFRNAKSVTFAYQDVLEDHISLDQLDQSLSTGTFKAGQNTVLEELKKDNVFVLTSTIKSNKITVTAEGESGVTAKVDVPVIQSVASGKLNLDLSKSAQGAITFEGTTPVVFGFQAAQVFTDEQGKFTLVKPSDPGKMALRKLGTIETTNLDLAGEGVFFRLDEAQGAATSE